LVGGIALLVGGMILRKQVLEAQKWPGTSGIVLESTIQSDSSQNGEITFGPKVVYEYQVAGKKFTSDQLALVEIDTANENAARAKAEKYPAGSPVTVHYDPRKPNMAFIEIDDPTHGALPWGMIIAGVILGVAGAVWLLVSQVRR
jgi:hypothetical protein